MLPTTRVNCHLFDFIGNGAVGKELRVTLTRSERDPDHGTVLSVERAYTVPESGLVELDLWPNVRGVYASSYRFQIALDGGRLWQVTANVPESGPVNLRSIIDTPAPQSVDVATQAVIDAQAAATAAEQAVAIIPDPDGEALNRRLVSDGAGGWTFDDPGAGGGGGGPAVWGAITGTLADQTDLQAALSAKLETETDPTVPAHVKAITSAQVGNWDTAFSWGDHAAAGYLTTEADPTVPAHVKAITTGQITNWNAAFGWGDHAAAGYLSSESDPTVPAHVKAITSQNITDWNAAFSWGDHAAAGYLTSFTETDPTVPAHVKAITQQQIDDWDESTAGPPGDRVTAERVITGTSHTLEPVDAGAVLLFTSANEITVTIDPHAVEEIPALSVITLIQLGNGQVVIDPDVLVTVLGDLATAGANQALQLYQRESVNTWIALGGVEPD